MRFWNRLLVVLSMLSPVPASAGAWTQQQGNGIAIATLAYSEADTRFLDDGSTRRATDFRKTEARLYLEYGLTDWATVTAQPEWRRKKTGPTQGENVNGLGRIDAGLRLRVWQGETSVLSIQGSVRMPGTSDDLAPANGGDTEWELDGRLLFGRGFPVFGRNAFTDMQLGYRFRFGDPADELRFDLTSGIDLTPSILALVQSFNSVSVGTATGGFSQTREHKLSASLVYRFGEHWSVQAGGIVTVAGQNIVEEQGFFFGLWRSF